MKGKIGHASKEPSCLYTWGRGAGPLTRLESCSEDEVYDSIHVRRQQPSGLSGSGGMTVPVLRRGNRIFRGWLAAFRTAPELPCISRTFLILMSLLDAGPPAIKQTLFRGPVWSSGESKH